MSIFQSIILGILQGLGEFLPISSTAHLILAPWFFGWSDPGLAFDVALHLGTLLAVVLFFWRDWLIIIFNSQFSTLPTGRQVFNKFSKINFQSSEKSKYPQSALFLLIIASVPGAIFGMLLDSKAEAFFRSPLLIALSLSIVGLVLLLVDKHTTHRKNMEVLTFKDALLIGLSQAVAIIPGVSRSGATMTTGLALGLSREQAARFSFLLSTPIIFGAAMVKVPQLFKAGLDAPILFGILASAITGYLAIKFMLRFIQKVGYAPFFWYRLVLALVVAVVYYLAK